MSVVLVQEADIEARTQAASIQVAIDSQLAIGRKADRPRQFEDDVALADPAGSEEARSGRGLIGQIVERSSKSSDDPGLIRGRSSSFSNLLTTRKLTFAEFTPLDI
jgi:hypothetical protein